VAQTGDGEAKVKWLKAIDNKWVHLKGRKSPHLLLVFRKPERYIVLKQTIQCCFPTFWVLTHGSVKNWDWLDSDAIDCSGRKIMDNDYDMGLLVPRMFWLGLFFISAKRKIQLFKLKAERYEGSVPYIE